MSLVLIAVYVINVYFGLPRMNSTQFGKSIWFTIFPTLIAFVVISVFIYKTEFDPNSQTQKTNRAQRLYLRGSKEAQSGALQAALQDFEESIRLNPKKTLVHYDAAKVYAELKMFAQAEVEFKRTLQDMPDFAQCHQNLGNVLQAQGKISEAQHERQRAKDLKTSSNTNVD